MEFDLSSWYECWDEERVKWGECGVPMGTHGMGLGVWSDFVVSYSICLYIVTDSDTIHNTSVSSGDSETNKTSTEVASCKFNFSPSLSHTSPSLAYSPHTYCLPPKHPVPPL